MDDVPEQAAAMFVIGSNTTEQHPVFGTMIRQAVLRRRNETHCGRPATNRSHRVRDSSPRQRPGTDAALLNGLMHVILKSGWQDRNSLKSGARVSEDSPPVSTGILQKWSATSRVFRLTNCSRPPRFSVTQTGGRHLGNGDHPAHRPASSTCWPSATCKCCWETWACPAAA